MKFSQITGILSLGAMAATASASMDDYSAYGISIEGGVVIELVGFSGVPVIAEIGTADLFYGYYNSATNNFYNNVIGVIPSLGPEGYIADSILGVRNGYSPAIVDALGGGIAEMTVRLTEFDGGTAIGDMFDGAHGYAGIDLLVNGVNVADFESVGFAADVVETDYFSITDVGSLSAIYSSLMSTGEIVLGYDEGIDKGLAFVDFISQIEPADGVRPTIVPEPSALGFLGFLSVLSLVALRRRR